MAAPFEALDLSSRKRLRGERRFRELLDAAPDAIIEVSREGRILVLNGMTERLFGYQRRELLGQPVELLIPEDFGPRLARPISSGLALQGRRKDGSCFPVEISLGPVKSNEGSSIIAIVRDISERGIEQEQFRAMQEKLTSELQSRNRETERADRLKSEFLSSVSHELRTPLHTIMGFSELLAEELKGPLNDDQKRFIEHIRTDSAHLLELINEILDLSKIEAGRLDLRREALDMTAAIEVVLDSIRPRGEAKSIRIEATLPAGLMLYADCLRFKQILFNLLGNALKFTPEGWPNPHRCDAPGWLRRDCSHRQRDRYRQG